MNQPRGWYSRGYLPHIDAGRRTQFVTYRLADALPKSVLERWHEELRQESDEIRKKEIAQRIEAYCDAGHGSCLLRDPRLARIKQETIFCHHRRLYNLHGWVVMPNHIHLLLTPCEGVLLQTILQKLKGGSAKGINEVAGRSGRLWQPDYFDRLIRDEAHFEGVLRYLEWNPVKAKLCSDPKHWHWSSANDDSVKRLELLGERPPG